MLVRKESPATTERLRFLAECNDGFEIAERDLELRGPGDMMGLRQHGLPLMPKAADDEALFRQAFEDAALLPASTTDVEELARELSYWSRRRRGAGRRALGRECLEAG